MKNKGYINPIHYNCKICHDAKIQGFIFGQITELINQRGGDGGYKHLIKSYFGTCPI